MTKLQRRALIAVAGIAVVAGLATAGFLWRQHEDRRPSIIHACIMEFPGLDNGDPERAEECIVRAQMARAAREAR